MLTKSNSQLIKALNGEITALPPDVVVVLWTALSGGDPTCDDTWVGNLTEATFGGYARVPLTWVGSPARKGVECISEIKGTLCLFSNTTGHDQVIQGYAVISPGSAAPLLWLEAIPSGPITLFAGQSFAVRPYMSLRSLT